ncbi:response regulator FixJ [Caulobacter sp. NIBR1757]|uniref:response regulator FixJ n=1 Tax=Caulobacter sp. NIBR1757 TaxID=3016000 RepID=UPI0022F086E8|nr:response regulator FixJ [Caulobacter sp. NIBR1757]WGM38337.1 Transcriptional regulatory protein FixJ [Caulobacter sp. NIBR1757]
MKDRTVFIVDDDGPVRESLKFLFRTEGLTCRAYESALAFLAQLQPTERGCLVTDVRMPEMDGLELIAALRARDSQLPIIVITGHADVPMAVRAMKAGVFDFIEKPFDSDIMLRAVRACLEKVDNSEARLSERLTIDNRMSTLTERERQVLDAIVEGLSNKEVALSLSISPRTVEIYRANVMTKMQADSLSALVRMSLTAKAA